MLKQIQKARSDFYATNNQYPQTFSLSYDDAVCLLIEVCKSNSPSTLPKLNKIESLLLRGDRTEIKEYMNKHVTVYSMKLSVVDVTVKGVE